MSSSSTASAKDQLLEEKIELLIEKQSFYSGPLPHPEHAKAYEDVQPGAFDRILRMAETEQARRIETDKQEYTLQLVGLIVFALISAIALVGSIWLIGRGSSATGIATFIGSVASLVGVAWFRRKSDSKSTK